MNRQQIVKRNDPVLTEIQPLSPLAVGNGEFAFSADFTGLQSYPECYEVPLGTQSNWGWHYTGGAGRYTEKDIVFQEFETYGRKVRYPMKPEDKEEAYHWLRQNPHRLQLGRLAVRLLSEDGREALLDEVRPVRQELNLWTGVLHSVFAYEEEEIRVETACHPRLDCLGVRVASRLLAAGRLQLYLRFPAPDMTHRSWAKSVFPEWERDDRHLTELQENGERKAVFKRTMDGQSYAVRWAWDGGRLERSGPHTFTLKPHVDNGLDVWSCTVGFAPDESHAAMKAVHWTEINRESAAYWERFWTEGAAIDFSECTDPRAAELERRVVLSQFLCAVHSGGSLPPQETGLLYNSWFGKLHLEMHWWHAAHFPLWGRKELLLRSMDWYVELLPKAKALANSQGYKGARWPKMVGFDGEQTPSPVAPGLIWQQPHPTALAELCYLADPDPALLERYKEIVFEAADFMVSYAHWEENRQAYVLGPPLIPAQENHAMQDSINPPYELEYWKTGLETAVRWAERLGITPDPAWAHTAAHMASPAVQDGVYLAHERCPDTFTGKNHDHPSMLGALGLLSGSLVDPETMRATLLKVKECWDWESAWGWDFPMCAMTAARLGERELAVDFLLMEATKNTYLPSGHNYQRPGLWAYLPGNGGLLTTIAMMAAGWGKEALEDAGEQHFQTHNPGFPQDGNWNVRWEGLKPLP
ncbi:glycoside hydrolase family 65 [Paenibacillus sp. CN-4]|uniref:glycoside hydrolase family 65 n=1 Tax=Paenibacillus nanchangensis TaxID=3348343 RepID=UPI00397CB73A